MFGPFGFNQRMMPDIIFLILLYILVLFKKWRKQGIDVLAVNTVFYVYLCFVGFFTLMPFIVQIPEMFSHFEPMNLTPFIDVLMGRGDFIRQVVLNIFMTVPFGILYPLTKSGNGRFFKTVLCCFLMSFSIELLQGFMGFRSSDITDVITNVTGGIIGYMIYRMIRPIAEYVLSSLREE